MNFPCILAGALIYELAPPRGGLHSVMQVAIDESWRPYLDSEFKQPYMGELRAFLKDAAQSTGFCPPPSLVYDSPPRLIQRELPALPGGEFPLD